jgi:hypothetical protein
MIPTQTADNINAPYSREYARRVYKIQENREKQKLNKERDVLDSRASSEFYVPATRDVSKCHSSQRHFGLARPVSAGRIRRPAQVDPALVAGNEQMKLDLEREELAHKKLHQSIKTVLKEERSKKFEPKPWVPSKGGDTGYATDVKSKHKTVNKDAVEWGLVNKAWRRAPWPSLPQSAAVSLSYPQSSRGSRLFDSDNRNAGNSNNNSPDQHLRFADGEFDDLDARFSNEQILITPQSERGLRSTAKTSARSSNSNRDNNDNRSVVTGATKASNKLAPAQPHVVITGVLIDRTTPTERYRHGILLVPKDSSTMDIARAVEKQFNFKGLSDLSITTQNNGYGNKDLTTKSLALGTLEAYPVINETTTFVAFTGGEPIDLEIHTNVDPDEMLDHENDIDTQYNRISKQPQRSVSFDATSAGGAGSEEAMASGRPRTLSSASSVSAASASSTISKRSVLDFRKIVEKDEESARQQAEAESYHPIHHNNAYENTRTVIRNTGTFSSPDTRLSAHKITAEAVNQVASSSSPDPASTNNTPRTNVSPKLAPYASKSPMRSARGNNSNTNNNPYLWSTGSQAGDTAAGNDNATVGMASVATAKSVRSTVSRGQRVWEETHGKSLSGTASGMGLNRGLSRGSSFYSAITSTTNNYDTNEDSDDDYGDWDQQFSDEMVVLAASQEPINAANASKQQAQQPQKQQLPVAQVAQASTQVQQQPQQQPQQSQQPVKEAVLNKKPSTYVENLLASASASSSNRSMNSVVSANTAANAGNSSPGVLSGTAVSRAASSKSIARVDTVSYLMEDLADTMNVLKPAEKVALSDIIALTRKPTAGGGVSSNAAADYTVSSSGVVFDSPVASSAPLAAPSTQMSARPDAEVTTNEQRQQPQSQPQVYVASAPAIVSVPPPTPAAAVPAAVAPAPFIFGAKTSSSASMANSKEGTNPAVVKASTTPAQPKSAPATATNASAFSNVSAITRRATLATVRMTAASNNNVDVSTDYQDPETNSVVSSQSSSSEYGKSNKRNIAQVSRRASAPSVVPISEQANRAKTVEPVAAASPDAPDVSSPMPPPPPPLPMDERSADMRLETGSVGSHLDTSAQENRATPDLASTEARVSPSNTQVRDRIQSRLEAMRNKTKAETGPVEQPQASQPLSQPSHPRSASLSAAQASSINTSFQSSHHNNSSVADDSALSRSKTEGSVMPRRASTSTIPSKYSSPNSSIDFSNASIRSSSNNNQNESNITDSMTLEIQSKTYTSRTRAQIDLAGALDD